jgi:thioredoxin-related protein
MVWPQDLDLSDQMQDLFSVRSFPTFIVTDRRGAILFRTDGYGPEVEGEIEDAIDKALKKKWQPQTPKPSQPSSPTR